MPNQPNIIDVAVIGGGASGLAAAVVAARQAVVARKAGTGNPSTGAQKSIEGARKAAGDQKVGVHKPREAARHDSVGEAARVVVFESTDKVGRSILRSGNGRCNFSNANIANFTKEDFERTYRNGSFVFEAAQSLERAFLRAGLLGVTGAANSFDSAGAVRSIDSTVASDKFNAVFNFFKSLGLVWREEADGRVYPLSGKASTILNILRETAQNFGVEEVVDTRICRIEPRHFLEGERGESSAKLGSAPTGESSAENANSFILHTSDGRMIHARRVILAAGGKTSADILRDLQPAVPHTKQAPVLVSLALKETNVTRTLDNIRVKCSVSVLRGNKTIAKESGEVLFRKYGVSGIAVFNLSRFAQAGDTLRINLLEQTQTTIENIARNIENFTCKPATCANVLRGIVQEPLARAVIKAAGVKPDAHAIVCEVASQPESPSIATASNTSANNKRAHGKVTNAHKLAHTLCNFDFTVTGTGDPKLAQVSRGGFSVKNVDPQTMQVRCCPGLFITGEALDIDAPCGGFNLHWAWTSALLTGLAAGQV